MWQETRIALFQQSVDTRKVSDALREHYPSALTAATVRRQQEGQPAHTWEPACAEEAGAWSNRYRKAGQIMETDFLSVQEDDPVYFVANLMNWRRLRYLPVEDEQDQLTGLFTSRHLLQYVSSPQKHDSRSATIRDFMIKDPITVSPDVPSLEALQIMRSKKIGFLPVVDKGQRSTELTPKFGGVVDGVVFYEFVGGGDKVARREGEWFKPVGWTVGKYSFSTAF